MKRFFAASALAMVFSMLPIAVQAANLYFSPSSGSYAVDSPITVNVYVSSADQAINAASGAISFPNDTLEITSLSKTGSLFTLWVQEPSFSNSAGTVNFEGIVLNPGFTGASGKILSIIFKTKAAGSAPLTFSSGSVLANDGKGTNILTDLKDAHFLIGTIRSETPKIIIPVQAASAPTASEIHSPTHSDPNKWYAVKDAKFTWDVPKNSTAVRLLAGKIPHAIPAITYTTPINSKEITDVADGVWYFHVRLRDAQEWGDVSHFRFQIDTEKPTRFNITEIPREDPTDQKAAFIFDAEDKTSGIDYYDIQIDNQNSEIWRDNGSHRYETAAIRPGRHTLIAKVIDKAQNTLVNSVEFTIDALTPPEITEYPRTLQSGDILTVKGKTAYPNGEVTVWLQREHEEAKSITIISDNKGEFIFIADEKMILRAVELDGIIKLKDDIYRLWAEAMDKHGTKSEPSVKVTIAMQRSALLKMGSWAMGFLTVVIPLIALIILLAALLWYGWHTLAALKKGVKKEVREAEQALHQAFYLLKEDVRTQIKMLEKTRTKRQLTQEEEKIVKQFKKDLNNAEKFVKKEIQDIEQKIK
ncbi:MAG: cohesin domain-containing protein [Candidatus Sungbacteria bacterium]|nr:cohesin domain-containing protein [Candidatus Sungbacteria bacterium]